MPPRFCRPLALASILVIHVAWTGAVSAQSVDYATLEQRVVEELTARGVRLSELDRQIQLNSDGANTVLSVIRASTGETIATAEIADIGTDPAAAAYRIADLVQALAGPPAPRAEPQPQPEPAPRQLALEQYEREFIGFNASVAMSTSTNVINNVPVTSTAATTQWNPYRGMHEHNPLSAPEFYRAVGRPDLAVSYQKSSSRRRTAMVVGTLSTVGLGVSSVMYLVTSYKPEVDFCSDAVDFQACIDAGTAREERRKREADAASGGCRERMHDAVIHLDPLLADPASAG